MINFGFFFGFLLGIPLVFLTEAFPHWWVLPIGGRGHRLRHQLGRRSG